MCLEELKKCTSSKTLVSFLDRLEAVPIGMSGGRRFRLIPSAEGQAIDGTISLKDIMKHTFALKETLSGDADLSYEVPALIKYLDNKGNEELAKIQGCFTKMWKIFATAISRLFGNTFTCFNKDSQFEKFKTLPVNITVRADAPLVRDQDFMSLGTIDKLITIEDLTSATVVAETQQEIDYMSKLVHGLEIFYFEPNLRPHLEFKVVKVLCRNQNALDNLRLSDLMGSEWLNIGALQDLRSENVKLRKVVLATDSYIKRTYAYVFYRVESDLTTKILKMHNLKFIYDQAIDNNIDKDIRVQCFERLAAYPNLFAEAYHNSMKKLFGEIYEKVHKKYKDLLFPPKEENIIDEASETFTQDQRYIGFSELMPFLRSLYVDSDGYIKDTKNYLATIAAFLNRGMKSQAGEIRNMLDSFLLKIYAIDENFKPPLENWKSLVKMKLKLRMHHVKQHDMQLKQKMMRFKSIVRSIGILSTMQIGSKYAKRMREENARIASASLSAQPVQK